MGDHETSKIDRANHLLLDQPLLRLPYELSRMNFRSVHFLLEKANQTTRNQLKETASGSLGGHVSPEEALAQTDAALARLKTLRRRVAAAADDEDRLYRQVGARASHLAALADMRTLDDVKYEAWSRRRLDRLLVDYLLRQGYIDSARALAEEKDMADLVDVETFQQASRIREALRNGSVVDALAWCNENKKELRKMDSKLEFMLRFQQYIELARGPEISKLMEAIQHAKKYLLPYKESYPNEVDQAAGLLVIPSNAQLPDGYIDLWAPSRWEMLADLFTKTHQQLLGLPSVPLLHIALSAGLSALKTPACHSHAPSSAHDDTPEPYPAAAHAQQRNGRNAAASTLPPIADLAAMTNGGRAGSAALSSSGAANNPGVAAGATTICPICSTELNELARSVPYAHHSKSHVEHDLLLLPSSRVYGRARLEEHAAKAGLAPGYVKDFATGEVLAMDTLKKVYIT